MWSGPVLIKPGRLLWGVWLMIIACCIHYAWPVKQESVFHAAHPVPQAERESVAKSSKLRMLAYWAEHNESCAVSAPDVDIYENYLIKKQGESIQELFNLRILPFPDASLVTVEEKSPRCTESRTIQRYSQVWIVYDTVNEDGVTAFIDDLIEAVCIQHFVNVLNGIWPC